MSNLLLAPGPVQAGVALAPVYNNLATLYMLALANMRSGWSAWIEKTVARLSPEQIHTHRLFSTLLYSAYEPDEDWPTFPAYLAALAQRDPLSMRNRTLRHMFPCIGETYAQENRLMDLETFVATIDRSEFDHDISPKEFAEAYALLDDPPALRDAVVAHLTEMWHVVLAEEWERNEPLLNQVVDAFGNSDLSGQTGYEAIRTVTGRDAIGNWQRVLGLAETLLFIPSCHIGPYLLHFAYPPMVRIVFGARFPTNTTHIPAALTRVDLLVQLRALTDETRLHILDLILAEGELCAQEIIARLQLSKSSASRHLSQLSATGYLIEHQREGKTKCYTLNPVRFQETLRCLERYTE